MRLCLAASDSEYRALTLSLRRRQIFHIRRSFQLLGEERTRVVRAARERVRTGSATSDELQREKADLQRLAAQEKSLKNDCWVQAGYLPLTAHWYALLPPSRDYCHIDPHQGALAGLCRAAFCPTTLGSECAVPSQRLQDSTVSGSGQRKAVRRHVMVHRLCDDMRV